MMRSVAAVAALLLGAMTGAGPVAARQGAAPAGGVKKSGPAGFALKKTTPGAGGTVEIWERATDGAQLRIETVPNATPAVAETRLKAVNAKIGKKGFEPEELLFRSEINGPTMAWTNYRATNHITFTTYRYWKIQDTKLVMADLSFPRGKPDANGARGAFITAKRAADGKLRAM